MIVVWKTKIIINLQLETAIREQLVHGKSPTSQIKQSNIKICQLLKMKSLEKAIKIIKIVNCSKKGPSKNTPTYK